MRALVLASRMCSGLMIAALAACGAIHSGSTPPIPTLPTNSISRTPGQDPPEKFIAVTDSGDIVVATTASGKIERVLVERSITSGRVGSLAFSPDLLTLYFVNARVEDCTAIMGVPISGGSAVEVAKGTFPEISSDGRHLAWAQMEGYCGSKMKGKLHVRDLVSRQTRSWTDTSDIGSFAAVLFFVDEKAPR